MIREFSVVALLALVFEVAAALGKESIDGCEISILGAGIGGLYTAWRLAVDSETYDGSKICVFEAKRRIGGRWLSIHNPAPGFDGFTVDLGAYRAFSSSLVGNSFHRKLHRQMRLLTEDALGFDTQCYTDPLDRDGGLCISGERKIVYTRGKNFGITPNLTADDALKSYNPNIVPYVIPVEYQWGPGKPLESPRRPYDFLLGPASVVKEIGERWEELQAEKDYSRAMQIADEIIEKMKTGSYRGIPYTKVSLLQAARAEGLTPEELALFFDTDWSVGENFVTRMDLSELGRLNVRYVALLKDEEGLSAMVTPVQKQGNVRRRIGLGSIADRLLQEIQRAGVRVYLEHKGISVQRCRGSLRKICLEFEGGRGVRSDRLFLNVGKRDLIALGVSSEPIQSSGLAFKRAVENMEIFGLSKTYCFWDDAWWMTKLKQTRGRSRSHGEDIFSMRYSDGNVVCENTTSLEGCRGALLTSYVLGDYSGAASAIYAHSYNEVPYTPLTNDDAGRTLIYGNTTGPGQLYLNDLHSQLKRVHLPSFQALGFPDIDKALPPPVACVYADWKDIGVHNPVGPSKIAGVDEYNLYTRPVQALAIHLVGEAWGQDKGWAESSLNSVERVLHHELNLSKPEWMDESFHGSVIRRFNGGTPS